MLTPTQCNFHQYKVYMTANILFFLLYNNDSNTMGVIKVLRLPIHKKDEYVSIIMEK